MLSFEETYTDHKLNHSSPSYEKYPKLTFILFRQFDFDRTFQSFYRNRSLLLMPKFSHKFVINLKRENDDELCTRIIPDSRIINRLSNEEEHNANHLP